MFLKFLQADHIGIININLHLKKVLDQWASFVQQITEDKYGHTPEIRISGHVNAKFPYIELPLDYILPELLKNAVRSTIEAHPGTKGKNLPPIYVTVANNPIDFIIKISDRGGGIPHDRYEKVAHFSHCAKCAFAFSTSAIMREVTSELDDISSALNSFFPLSRNHALTASKFGWIRAAGCFWPSPITITCSM